ncbi:DUF4342 domain-containing protein [Clostridium thermarum]|uniref:DUF4342 domain-containing protein n=1 Tax=Clostridium thermarum TaxID=1716543 RepID=UPI00112282A9|nr:DUF4342 domain-containing protein [Clostridium thermarum]
MNVTLEMIDMLRQRANVSYEEAKTALEACGGDMVEALVYLERNNKIKTTNYNSPECGFINSVKRLIKKGQETRFLMTKQDKIVINVPVNVVVLTTIFAAPVTIAGVAVGLFTNHRIKFIKPDGGNMEINKVLDKMSAAVATMNTTNEIVQK